MKIAISIDSACDMPKEIIEKNNIYTIPYYVIMGETEHKDGKIDSSSLFAFVKENGTLPKTGAPNDEMFREYFKDILKTHDAVIHFSLSSKMTSACDSAIKGAKGLNVSVIDSHHLSSGIAILVLQCLEMLKAKMDLEQIVEKINAMRDRVQTSFLVDTLKYLYKGGRCSSLAMLSAKLLMIKPKISVIYGEMKVTKKYMGGINGCLMKYVEDCLKQNNPDTSVVFVTHSSPMPISEKICNRLKEYGFKQVYDCNASSTISTHCGPGTLGILFLNKE